MLFSEMKVESDHQSIWNSSWTWPDSFLIYFEPLSCCHLTVLNWVFGQGMFVSSQEICLVQHLHQMSIPLFLFAHQVNF